MKKDRTHEARIKELERKLEELELRVAPTTVTWVVPSSQPLYFWGNNADGKYSI